MDLGLFVDSFWKDVGSIWLDFQMIRLRIFVKTLADFYHVFLLPIVKGIVVGMEKGSLPLRHPQELQNHSKPYNPSKRAQPSKTRRKDPHEPLKKQPFGDT